MLTFCDAESGEVRSHTGVTLIEMLVLQIVCFGTLCTAILLGKHHGMLGFLVGLPVGLALSIGAVLLVAITIAGVADVAQRLLPPDVSRLDSVAGATDSLDLSCCRLKDSGLERVAHLRQLKKLVLVRTKITDAGLVHLDKGLQNLHWLNLKWTKITDKGLARLSGLTSLSELYLPRQITDAGLKHLKSLTKLSKLNLKYSKITNAGVLHLHGLTQLTQLKLPSRAADRAVDELRRMLPNCKISRY